MSEGILTYLLKVNLILAVCWLVYRLFFYGLPYFQTNRLYLLGSLLIAFLIPLIPLPGFYPDAASLALPMPVEMVKATAGQAKTTHFNWPMFLMLVWGTGVLVFSLRFILRLASLLRLWIKTQPASWQTYRYRKLSGNDQPFSFFGFIFLNPGQYQEAELSYIFQHESVHVRQGHTFDILLAETIKIGFWWNPVVYWLKHEIQTNLEFIADRTVLQSGVCKKTYQLSLLKVLSQQPFQVLSTAYSFFKLKPRIKMMNLTQTNGLGKLRYLLVLPLLFSITLSCADEQEEIFSIPPPPAAPQAMAFDAIDYTDETIGFFVDGEEVSGAEFQALNKEGFARTEFCENADGTKTLKVYSKPADDQQTNEKKPIYVLNGKPISEKEMKEIDPTEIDAITVLKGEKAVEKYGEMGKEGVVEITLKN